jgi:hypothetical protein
MRSDIHTHCFAYRQEEYTHTTPSLSLPRICICILLFAALKSARFLPFLELVVFGFVPGKNLYSLPLLLEERKAK